MRMCPAVCGAGFTFEQCPAYGWCQQPWRTWRPGRRLSSGSDLLDPHRRVVEGDAAERRNLVGANEGVDPLPGAVRGVGEHALGDQNALLHSIKDARRELDRAPGIAEADPVAIGDPLRRSVVR